MTVRAAVRSLLPPRAVHAYRRLRHTVLFPFEPEIRLIPRYLDRTKLAVDVGADVGLYTSILAPRSALTLAIEPNPNSARYLRSLRLAHCQIIDAAASNENGETVLRVPQMDGAEYRALGSISDQNDIVAPSVVTYGVRTVTLDSVLANRPAPVSFIKIDVEGHELAVLQGATAVIQDRPTFLIEIEYRHGTDAELIFAFLRERGYSGTALINGELKPIDAKALASAQTDDLLRIKRASPRFAGYVNNVLFTPGPH
jgi:FkbM family methyltransferase